MGCFSADIVKNHSWAFLQAQPYERTDYQLEKNGICETACFYPVQPCEISYSQLGLTVKRSTTSNLVVIFMGVLAFWLSTQHVLLVNTPQWQRAEGQLIDQRYYWRGPRPANTNIVLIGLMDSSRKLDTLAPEEIELSPTLRLMSQPFPWNRQVYAALLDKLMDAGAKVVVFDAAFDNIMEGDVEFAGALKHYQGHVVIVSHFEDTPNQFHEEQVTTQSHYTLPDPELLNAATTNEIGYATVFSDEDGVVRRGRYRTSSMHESHAMDKYMAEHPDIYFKDYPDDLLQMSALAVKDFFGHVETPPYDHDNFIDFQGPAQTYLPLPVESLFVDKLWNNPPINGPTAFKNKIVIFGAFDTLTHDAHSTVWGEMPGPELQAQMMATLLDHSSLREPSHKTSLLLTLAMTVLAVAICLAIRNALLKPSLLILTVLGFLAASQYAFSHGGMVIDMMPPLFSFVTAASLGLISQFMLEQVERRHYLNLLERCVSKNVAKSIVADTRSFVDSLKGRKQPVTVMFSDIRDFTTLSEGLDPEKLVQQLNEYFLEMVGTIQDEENGTLQKFIGDAIMAAWGDVRTDGPEEDARHAIRAALKMRANLVRLNEKWKTVPNRVPLRTGIGVNHGEMIVGNIGTPKRTDFTVLGDGVNLAARLETATKQFHTDLLVGESVEALTRPHFIFRRVGLLTVKGKSKPVEAYTVLGERPEADPAWLARYHKAITLFRRREFEAASAMFQSVADEIGQPDFLCQMYTGWCASYIKTPPPADWNGTHVLSEK